MLLLQCAVSLLLAATNRFLIVIERCSMFHHCNPQEWNMEHLSSRRVSWSCQLL